MSDQTEVPVCPSKAYVQDELTHCQLDDGHGGVHLGKIHLSEGADRTGVELVQWKDADAATDTDPVSEMPAWYSALPVGHDVQIGFVDERDNLHGDLVGAVLDDHEQPAALVVHSSSTGRRVLVPWQNVALVAWELDQ